MAHETTDLPEFDDQNTIRTLTGLHSFIVESLELSSSNLWTTCEQIVGPKDYQPYKNLTFANGHLYSQKDKLEMGHLPGIISITQRADYIFKMTGKVSLSLPVGMKPEERSELERLWSNALAFWDLKRFGAKDTRLNAGAEIKAYNIIGTIRALSEILYEEEKKTYSLIGALINLASSIQELIPGLDSQEYINNKREELLEIKTATAFAGIKAGEAAGEAAAGAAAEPEQLQQ